MANTRTGMPHDKTMANRRRASRRISYRRQEDSSWRHQMTQCGNKNTGIPCDTTLTNRRWASRRLSSRRRNKISNITNRSLEYRMTLWWQTDAKRRAACRPDAELPVANRQDAITRFRTWQTEVPGCADAELLDAYRHDAITRHLIGKYKPWYDIRNLDGKSMQSVATYIVLTPKHGLEWSEEEPRDAIRHDAATPTHSKPA
jgi:hypothetical protein